MSNQRNPSLDDRLPPVAPNYSEPGFSMLRGVYANTSRVPPDPVQLKLRMALIFSYLRPENIPDTGMDPEQTAYRFKFAALALKGLTVFIQKKWTGISELLLSVITDAWELQLWPWTTAIYERGIRTPQAAIPTGLRRNLLNDIVEALYYYSQHGPLSDRVRATKNFKPLLINMWYLEANDSGLDPDKEMEEDDYTSFSPEILTPRLLSVYLPDTVEPDTYWAPDFLQVADNQAVNVAGAALTQFNRSVVQMQTRPNFHRLYDDVHTLNILSGYIPFRDALLSQHSIRIARAALAELLDLEPPTKQKDLNLAGQCVLSLRTYLQISPDDTEGVSGPSTS